MKNKILIVDDSQVNRQSLADILREDYEIVFAIIVLKLFH